MEQNKIICVNCPMGCRMTIQSKDAKITSIIGNTCPKGIKYAEEEFINPLRILPTTVKVIGGELPLVSVKTEKAIPKKLLLEAMAEIAEIKVNAPVKIGQVIKDDLMGTGVSLIATRNVKRVGSNPFSYKNLR
jgi:CxxC motif-containing protein